MRKKILFLKESTQNLFHEINAQAQAQNGQKSGKRDHGERDAKNAAGSRKAQELGDEQNGKGKGKENPAVRQFALLQEGFHPQ